MYAFFKKRDNKFVGFTEHKPISDLYLIKEVGNIDPMTVRWAGDYNNGKIVPIMTPVQDYNETHTMYEADIKKTTGDRIRGIHKLSLHKQLNAIMDQINYMCEKLNIDTVDSYSNCVETIKAELDSMQAVIKQVSENPDMYTYVKKGEEEEFLNKQLF